VTHQALRNVDAEIVVGSQVPRCVTNNKFQAPSWLNPALALAAGVTPKIAANMQTKSTRVYSRTIGAWKWQALELEMIEKAGIKPTFGRLFFLDLSGGRVLAVSPDGSDLKTIVSEGRGPETSRRYRCWTLRPVRFTGLIWVIVRRCAHPVAIFSRRAGWFAAL
jgi:hypothetical protein